MWRCVVERKNETAHKPSLFVLVSLMYLICVTLIRVHLITFDSIQPLYPLRSNISNFPFHTYMDAYKKFILETQFDLKTIFLFRFHAIIRLHQSPILESMRDIPRMRFFYLPLGPGVPLNPLCPLKPLSPNSPSSPVSP